MDAPGRYPAARPRASEPAPAVAEKYERYESSGPLDVGDTLEDFFEFSGRPDCIDLTATVGGVVVRLLDKVGREQSDLVVPSGTTIRTYISRERIQARELVAAAGAQLTAVGKWASPREHA